MNAPSAHCPQTGLPLGLHPAPLPTPHFPTRWQAVLWRNWSLLTPGRLAAVLQASEEQIIQAAADLGLRHPATPPIEQRWLHRGYITLIRQNWHLLPYAQLLTLLGWSADQLAYALKEDDFLWIKLGRGKPAASLVRYEPLDALQRRRTRDLARLVAHAFPNLNQPPVERPFDFVDTLQATADHAASPPQSKSDRFGLKLSYAYGAIYGDPLLDAALTPYPPGVLARLAEHGVNAVWLPAVLYTLVPWLGNLPASAGHQTRLANLRDLVERAARHGIGVYLYLNEPRGMPAEALADHTDWQGGYYPDTQLHALCPGSEVMLRNLEAAVRQVYEQVPGLAGAVTITMSENLTHCRSKPRVTPCPRCGNLPLEQIVADINNALVRGIRQANPAARVIVWTWGWNDRTGPPGWDERCIERLSPAVSVMSTSEAYLPTDCMGHKGIVGDYALSKIGPGDHALRQWRKALACGLPVVAKVQLNNTWECSAVPYLPTPLLAWEHLRRLESVGVDGLMVAWTLGGYPGGNLDLLHASPERLAHDTFGEPAAPTILRAWELFSQAFAHFPIHGVNSLYLGPQNYGPMNLLHEKPTGRQASMLGFPYDDLDGWRGPAYPRRVFEKAFAKLSVGWGKGLHMLASARPLVPADRQAAYDDLWRVAQVAYCHFRSTCLQIRFIRLRDEGAAARRPAAMRRILKEEVHLAGTLCELIRHDARLGYEASNHYYYTPQSLMEKVIDCHRLMDRLAGESRLTLNL